MKNKPSCLFRVVKLFICVILIATLIAYFLLKEKPYNGKHPPTQGNTVTIFLIDGLSKSIFNEQLTAGKLPNLQKLIEKSTYIEHGIGAFPSMTGYAFYPFLTGEDATKSGILGLRWFDRSRDIGNLRHYVGRTNIQMNKDIHATPKTLFEKYDQYYTASINTYMNRGVHHVEMTSWAHTTSKYQAQSLFKALHQIPFLGETLSKNHFQHETLVMDKTLQQLAKNPKVQWITFPSPDASNHVLGTTAEYYQLLTHIDSLIGIFINEVARLGQAETRMIAVVTDHGILDVSKNLDIPAELKRNFGIDLIRGKATHLYSDELKEKLTDFIDKQGYFVINGNLSAYIYLRDVGEKPTPQYWRNRQTYETLEQYPCTISGKKTTINLPQSVAKMEGVELVACRKNDSMVVVFSENGKGEIVFNKSKGYKYSILGEDPLTYSKDSVISKMISMGYFSANQWLESSLETAFPDAIFRLYQLMMAEKGSDLLITSKTGYDLAADYEIFVKNYKGGHGGLRSELLDVPYILYNPKASGKRLPYLRAEDVGLTILEYMENGQ